MAGEGARVSRPLAVAGALGLWAAWYAAYRLYYAAGGHVGMIGRPASPQEIQRINLIGGAIILLAALLPLIAIRASLHQRMPKLVARLSWIAGVAFVAHALTMMVIRVLSLTGVHPSHYPAGIWLSINRHEADLQDLFFNEPWFLIEGCLWLLFATIVAPSSQQRFLRAAAVVTVLAVGGGVLAELGALPSLIVA